VREGGSCLKNLSERISYLKGLSEGINVAELGPQGKIMNGILDVLEGVIDDICVLRTEMEEFKEYVQSIDDDLNLLEEDIYGDDYIYMTCKKCGEEVYFDADVLEDDDVIEIICPKCNEVVFVNDGSFDFEPSVMESGIEGENSPSPDGRNSGSAGN